MLKLADTERKVVSVYHKSITLLVDKLLYDCCRLSHFDYVKSEDLERIGMGKPAIRRLVDAVKKRNRKKNLFDKVFVLCFTIRFL